MMTTVAIDHNRHPNSHHCAHRDERRESNESPALFLYHLWTAKTTQRGTQRHNRRMAAGSNGVLCTDGTWVGEAVVASDTNEQRSPRSALALHAL